MLLSRFWVLVLACLAITGIGAALLARGIINRQHAEAAAEALHRDRFGLESLLRLDARARIDALSAIAADSTVRQALRTEGQSRIDGQDGKKALRERLRTLNQKLEELRADLLIAVDGKGIIVAQEGRREAREGAGLGRIPLVERALAGYLGDDVWVYDGGVYRMAARPVIDRGQFVGALVHAQRLDAVLAQRLSERLRGATVAFFFGDKVVASYAPTDVPGAPTQSELAPHLSQVLADAEVQKGERSQVIDLGERGRAVYSLVAGSASSADVGYAIARPVRVLASPWTVFDETTKADVDGLPKAELVLALVLMLALAMGTLYLERDRPLGTLQSSVERLAQGQAEELDLAILSGRYRKLGEQINRALEAVVAQSGGKRRGQKANLDEILGPAPEALTSSAFSFGSAQDNDEIGPLAAPEPVAMPMPGSPVARPAPVVAPPSVSAPTPQPRGSAPARRVPAPPPSSKASAAPRTVNARPSIPGDEEVSVVSVVAEMESPSREDTRDEEAVFREVFDQYVALRTQCGESTAELTFEKFAVTLRKNRDRIVEQRPGTKQVRFTVYAKAGKAALRASPVKMG